jgi:beta-D-xylosidase 4
MGFQYPDCVNGPLASNTVCDMKASPPDRAAALVKAMNITEKLANLVEYVIHDFLILSFPEPPLTH